MPLFTRSIRLPALLIGLSLLTLIGGCAGKNQPPDGSADPFADEPEITAETHFAAGELAESRTVTPLPNGQMPSEKQIRQFQAAALNQYAQALQINPHHAASLYRIAVIRTDQRHFDQAVEAWKRYVEAVGKTPDSLVNLALALELAGRPADAEEAYESAITVDPTHKPARVNLGMLQAKQGRLQAAASNLSAVLSPAAVQWHLAVALEAAEKPKLADQHYRAAADLDPAYAQRPDLSALSK